jgi:hypothetical protein
VEEKDLLSALKEEIEKYPD